MRELGIAFTEGWPALSLGLHALAVVFRLPVVWIKARMRDLTQEAAAPGHAAASAVSSTAQGVVRLRLSRFRSALAIVWLMISRPPL